MMKIHIEAAIVLLVSLGICAFPDNAAARKVYSPTVEQGEFEIGYLLDYSVDANPAINRSARHQFEMEYGVTDHWLTAVYGDFRKRPGQTFAYQGFKWENIYQLFGEGEQWLDAGLYLEYFKPKASLNQPDAFEFKLLLEKESGRLVNTANLIFTREVGRNAVTSTIAGYAWRSKWSWQREIEAGIELYGSLGPVHNTNSLSGQQHQLGVVLLGKLPGDLSYEIGYLFGLTSATERGMIKCVIAYEL